MLLSKIRLVAFSLVATLAVACASTTEPEQAGQEVSASGETSDEGSANNGTGEDGEHGEDVGETSSAATRCAVVCTFRYQSDNREYLYSCRGCGTTFDKRYPYAKGSSFCYSRYAC